MILEQNKIGESVIKRYEEAVRLRQPFEDMYRDIDKYVFNAPSYFNNMPSPGEEVGLDIFDTTAIVARTMLSSVLQQGLTSTEKKWFSLTIKDKALKNSFKVKAWLEETTGVMLDVFNSPESNFATSNSTVIDAFNGYGTGCMYGDADEYGTINFNTKHLSNIYILEDANGTIDTVFYAFEYTARQALQKYPKELLPDQLVQGIVSDPDKKYRFIHVCVPKRDAQLIHQDAQPLADIFEYVSYTVCVDNKKIVERKGQMSLPYIVGRFSRLSNEVYGRSPSWDVMPDIKMANVMTRADIEALQLSYRPPLAVPDDSVFREYDISPNSLIPGGVNEDGRQMVLPINTGARPGLVNERIRDLQNNIRRAFFVHEYFQKEGTPLTATEINKKIRDSQILGSPNQFRLISEFYNKIIKRVFQLLLFNNKIPAIPAELLDENKALKYDIEYVSTFVRQQKFDELEAFGRAFQSTAPIFQIAPEALDSVDTDALFRHNCEIAGVPLSLMREYDGKPLTLEEYRQQKQALQQQQMQQAAEAQQIARTPQQG